MNITFQRDDLYRDVWSRPLTKIAAQHGLSDNGVRKICKAMNVPLPKAGHWAKIAAGQSIEPDALPTDAEVTTYTCELRAVDESEDAARDKLWCREQELQERLSENRIVVDLNPRQWHSVLVPYRDSHKLAAKEYERLKKRAETKNAKSKPAWPDRDWEDSWKWNAFERSGHVLVDSHKALPLKVSIHTHERALAILNELFFAGQRRGFEVSLSRGEKRFVFTGLGGDFEVRLVERIETRVDPNRKADSPSWETTSVAIPTGRLRLCLEDYPGSTVKEFKDEVDLPLEEKLNSVFEYAYRLVAKCRARARVWEREKRERELASLRREEVQRQQRELAQQAEEEQRRRKALEQEANDWHRANLIRQYVSYVTSTASAAVAKDLDKWVAWSLRVADEIDPTLS